MNKIDQKIYNLSRELKCLANEVCTLSEGNTETDPVFTASPSFSIASSDINNWNDAVSLSHEHFNMATLSGISSTNVTNWNNAYAATQNLANNYFPLQGGTLTGNGGNGFVGLPTQNTNPTTPAANNVSLFSNNNGHLSWISSNGFVQIFSSAGITGDRTYIFPNVNGSVIVDAGTQTLTGAKTFSATITAANIVPDGDNTRTLGSPTLRMSTVYAIHVSKGNVGNSFNLAVTNTTDIYMRVQATTNNFVFQQAGNAPAETGYKVTIDGTGATNGALNVLGGTSQFAGNILASANGTIDIGSTSNRIANIYTLSVRGNGTLRLSCAVGNGIVFQQTADTNTIGQFFATTGALGLQSPAGLMTDDLVNRLQVAGSVKATQYRLAALNTAPISATDTGVTGEIKIDADYIYVATATNTWKRASIVTW